MTWKCTQCGNENPDEDKFCQNCGMHISSAQQQKKQKVKAKIEPGETEEEMEEDAIVEGTILHSESKTPLENVEIKLEPLKTEGTVSKTTSNNLGEFTISLDPGQYNIKFKKQNFEKVQKNINLNSGKNPTISIQMNPVQKPEKKQKKPFRRIKVTIVNNPHERLNGEVFEYNLEEVYNVISIGRKTENLIVIPDKGISRKHAKIIEEKGKIYIKDMDSTNGTYLFNNASRVYEQVDKKELKDTQLIKLGLTTLIKVEYNK